MSIFPSYTKFQKNQEKWNGLRTQLYKDKEQLLADARFYRKFFEELRIKVMHIDDLKRKINLKKFIDDYASGLQKNRQDMYEILERVLGDKDVVGYLKRNPDYSFAKLVIAQDIAEEVIDAIRKHPNYDDNRQLDEMGKLTMPSIIPKDQKL
jgi:hypothetical protein